MPADLNLSDGGLHPEVVIAEKEVIIAKLHQQLEDEITTHDATKVMLSEVKAEADFLRRTNAVHEDYLTKIVGPLVLEIGKKDY
jgi:hypothetical protein